jgi:hypothetical protein
MMAEAREHLLAWAEAIHRLAQEVFSFRKILSDRRILDEVTFVCAIAVGGPARDPCAGVQPATRALQDARTLHVFAPLVLTCVFFIEEASVLHSHVLTENYPYRVEHFCPE